MKYGIIFTPEEFLKATTGWRGLIAADTETFGRPHDPQKKLLGLSLSPQYTDNGIEAIYIPFNAFKEGLWTSFNNPDLLALITQWIDSRPLVGHNFTYDKQWLASIGLKTSWKADTRIMWHLASAPSGPRPYGLKDAQIDLLGWEAKGDRELDENVRSKGGRLNKGDHYLADLEVLAKYACLDTYSTMGVFKKLKPFFDGHDYWWMLEQMMAYNELLEENTHTGILVDVAGLEKAHNRLLATKQAAMKRLNKELKDAITELERSWADRKIADYKREYNKTWYANHPEEWKKFNWNSDKDKRELFYDQLGFTPEYFTETGKPQTNADSIRRFDHPFVESYLKYEKANTISSNFSGPYLASVINSRLHPGFNICGTVSYRLSGFKPYLLNAPFDESAVLKNLQCDPGYVGIHSDLSAVEPSITAHYSEDPGLLKVFRDGLGDIYLDLALTLFPNDWDLHESYNPNIPITKEVKKRFERQRKIAKVIQLAVAYTGTGFTVAKNLTKDNIPTSVEKAGHMVSAYWRKFKAVERLNNKLKSLNRSQGLLRNIIGRIIRVPHPDYKDLPNRFIQSSGHDVLVLWVLEIDRLRKERNVDMKPVLIDCHDSTSWQVAIAQEQEGHKIFTDALHTVNTMLNLTITLKADTKRFTTLAGLKGEE